jgi:glutamyl-tRNA reductase
MLGIRIITEESMLNHCSYFDVAIVLKQTFYKNDDIQAVYIDDIKRIKEEKEARRERGNTQVNMILDPEMFGPTRQINSSNLGDNSIEV